MAISVFRLPDLGEGLADADVVEWYVAEGDAVELDQPVVALESAKAVVDIPSPVAGRVHRRCASPGDTVATGAPLVEFEVEGAVDDEAAGDVADTRTEADAAAAPGSARDDGTRRPRPQVDGEPAGSSRINAMPAARAKARELGVDLASVRGTGPGGRIRVTDIERAAAETAPDAGEPLRGVRRTMAERMAFSGARVVPVTVTEDADIGDWSGSEDVTVRLVRAVVAGCAESPALNAWLDGDAGRRTLHDAVHLGIAADTGDGLFVPVLRDAGAHEPAALRAEVDRLRAGAAARSLDPRELAGATITLSNFGMLAGRYATPVVLPPQVAILGAGRARDEPVVRSGTIEVRRVMPLSMTFDHRACTGAESSRFLAAVVADLERAA